MRVAFMILILTSISMTAHAEQCEAGKEVRANVICTNNGGENAIPAPPPDDTCTPGETKQVFGNTATCSLNRRWEMAASVQRPTNASAPAAANVPLPPRRPTNISAAAATPTPSRQQGSQRTPQNNAAEMLSSCKIAGSSVSSSCSASNINSNAGNFTSGASQNGQAMNSQQQAQVSDSCRQAGQNAQEANNAITTIMSQCQNAMSACSSACSSVNEDQLSSSQKSELANARNQCSSGSSAMANLQNQQNQVQQASARAQQCLADQGMGGMGTSADQTPTLDCNKTPNAPGCIQAKQDCTNPEFAATNEVCRCASGNCSPRTRSVSNPDDGAEKWADSSGESPTPGGPGSLGQDGNASGYQSSRTDSNLQGGGGGGTTGLSGASSTGANKPGLRRMGGPSKINTDVLNGSLGNRATGFGRSADSPIEGKGTYTASGSWIPPKVEKEPGTPNMDQFRPNMDPNQVRRPTAAAPMNVHKEIYASHVNMWKQMNLRYVELLKSLDP
ncbi:MAG: hypothetical protein KF681_09635 [Bdellovibrionaceae bacterium]|nr:hypothetical protein [Pseudobdellovibrionaceae bacterium]